MTLSDKVCLEVIVAKFHYFSDDSLTQRLKLRKLGSF